jgi:hypothetical protein
VEPFHLGDPVTLREARTDTLGRVVWISPDGETMGVRWTVRPGHEDDVTAEPGLALRKLDLPEQGGL